MNYKPPEKRRHATQKFIHALEELETVLKPKEPAKAPTQEMPSGIPPAPKQARSEPIASQSDESADISQLLDEAVQDIDQFIASTTMAEGDPDCK